MRRVLVAQSVGLWIRLNRDLSGFSEIDLVETPTVETGRLLAQLERPAIVVFGGESERADAEALVSGLAEKGSRETRVILTSDALEPTHRPFCVVDRSLVICTADELTSVVTELLAQSERPSEKLDLLVHYRSEAGTGSRTGFVIVLDLNEHSLLLLADHAFDRDAVLSLDFFLPTSVRGTTRDKVSLTCRIESCRDEDSLLYAAQVSSIDERATAAVRRFLTRDAA